MRFLKNIFIGNDAPAVYAHKSWAVRWESRHNEYSSGMKPEAEVFPIKEDAEAFKSALEAAFKLIRHTSRTNVTIEEQ